MSARPSAGSEEFVDPAHRLRRTRRTETLRSFVRETRIHPRQLVAPLFVTPGHGVREPIVQETLRDLRDADLDLVLIADTCLSERSCGGASGLHLGTVSPGRSSVGSTAPRSTS